MANLMTIMDHLPTSPEPPCAVFRPQGCPPFTHLTLTGGAIGSGLPMALGAALARPSARVICMEGDGSALYTPQALWSHARERAAVTTVICDNSSYQILKVRAACMHAHAGPMHACSSLHAESCI